MLHRKTWFVGALAGVAFAAGVSINLVAEEAKPTGMPASADQMAQWAKAATPGPQHQQLAKYAGEFNAEVKMWMDSAQAEPMTSTGKQRNEMILGGRHFVGSYEGDFMGQPFHGMTCTSYDNSKQKYQTGWIDDMSTGMIFGEGTADASGKTIAFGGEMFCHMTGKVQPYREALTFVDADTYKLEMHTADKSGKEFKSMEITYKRVK